MIKIWGPQNKWLSLSDYSIVIRQPLPSNSPLPPFHWYAKIQTI